jgi:hypothetical protein
MAHQTGHWAHQTNCSRKIRQELALEPLHALALALELVLAPVRALEAVVLAPGQVQGLVQALEWVWQLAWVLALELVWLLAMALVWQPVTAQMPLLEARLRQKEMCGTPLAWWTRPLTSRCRWSRRWRQCPTRTEMSGGRGPELAPLRAVEQQPVALPVEELELRRKVNERQGPTR